MEVITVESQVFKELMAKINSIAKFVAEHQRKKDESAPADDWVDGKEVCIFLQISKRTLQRLRSSGAVNYSLIRGKTFYKTSEIARLLEENIIHSSEENLQKLIKNHAKQRRNSRTDK